jgi:NAD(P)-dependent dehydrogenase (short-subunit alcohol dehydrogenase family)
LAFLTQEAEMPKSVLITGANRGLGLEFARQYASEGWRVFACCRFPEKSGALEDVASSGGSTRILRLDVRDTRRVFEVARELRGEPVDVLINNAGLYGPRDQPFGSVDEAEWLEVLRVNVIAPLKVAEAFASNVASSERRIIASVSSFLGSISDNTSGHDYPYRTSKAALNMVVKTMAVDLEERGILTVALSPGWVKTDMGGSGAPLSPRESVAGMRAVLDRLKPEDSGGFFHYDGERLPW